MSEVINAPTLDHPEIVQWSSRRGPLVGAGGRAPTGSAYTAGASAAVAIGALALGAFAIGALAIGALSIGRLAVGRARFRDVQIGRLEVEELIVRRRG